jgi:hypothetical protein
LLREFRVQAAQAMVPERNFHESGLASVTFCVVVSAGRGRECIPPTALWISSKRPIRPRRTR